MKIKIKVLNPKAKTPTKAYKHDAGYDLYVSDVEYKMSNIGQITYKFGIAIQIPKGHVGLIFPRSSICKTCLTLSNAVGVIDSGYRGEIMAVFTIDQHRRTRGAPMYKIGERAAQLVILKLPETELVRVTKLDRSDRGEGGYGSSGDE